MRTLFLLTLLTVRLVARAATAGAQQSACSPSDAAAATAIRDRLNAWVRAANADDRAAMRGIWASEMVGWSPRSLEVTDSAAYATARVPYRAGARLGATTYELVIEEIAARGDVAAVHDVWTEIRRVPGGSQDVQRVIRSSELWRCQADGQWRIARYVSAIDPWTLRPRAGADAAR